MKKATVPKFVICLALLCLGLFSMKAYAAIDNADILDNVLNRYASAASTWSSVVTARASWLFWTLVVISMVWTFGMMALRKADIGEFFAEFVRSTIFTGFFWWLLLNGPVFAISIIDSLRSIAGSASGSGNSISPSGVVDIGFNIFFKILDQASLWAPIDSGAGILMGLALLVVMTLIGVNMLILLISGWILAYAGVFFLGFGGSRWTSDLALNYFRTILNIAAQLFTMVLLVGIGQSFLDQYNSSLSAGLSLKELSVMFVAGIIFFVIINKIPPLVGNLAMGGGTHSLGHGFGAGAALGAATMGAAVASTSQAALSAGMANMAGGAQALMAAYSKASSAQSSQSSSGQDLLEAVVGGQSVGASNSESSSSQGGIFSSVANAGKIAAGTASNLAQGAYDVAKEKVNDMKEAAQSAISETTGGKIASAIEARHAGTENQQETNSVGPTSSSSLDTSSEVAAFRDRQS